jgi:hypothetical protein
MFVDVRFSNKLARILIQIAHFVTYPSQERRTPLKLASGTEVSSVQGDVTLRQGSGRKRSALPCKCSARWNMSV